MIPKIIHYCWFGDAPLSDMAQKCIASWRKYCPDYEIKKWNESNIDINSIDYMREAYEEKAWGFVPDVARLQVILEHGGIYLDTDVEIIKKIDSLLKLEAFIGFESKVAINLGQGFGAEPEHPLIRELLEDYKNLHFRNVDGTLNRRPSPGIQTDTLLRHGLLQENVRQTICGVDIFPTEYFCPISYNTGICEITENTYSIHHYVGSWLDEKERRWDERKRKCNRVLGERITNVLWIVVRLYRKIREKGMSQTIKLIQLRMRQKLHHEI